MRNLIMQIDDIKLSRDSKGYVEVHQANKVYNRHRQGVIIKWNFKGTFTSIYQALQSIIYRELLIDDVSILDLKSYLRQIDSANDKMLRALSNAKGELIICKAKKE